MKSLKEILLSEEVQKGLKSNIFNKEEDLKTTLQKVISFADEKQEKEILNIETEINGVPVIFENALYENKLYLLESRAFTKENGGQLGSYLHLLDSNGNIYKPDDDVWGDELWELVKSNNIQNINDEMEILETIQDKINEIKPLVNKLKQL